MKNASKVSSKYLLDRICKIKQHLNYINWWYKSKYSSSPKENFLSKITNRKKTSNEDFKLCEAEIFLGEIIKSVNSQTNNKSPNNDGLKAVFYKHFSNAIYKKGDKKDVEKYRIISFSNYYKIYTATLKGYLCYKTVFCYKVAIEG